MKQFILLLLSSTILFYFSCKKNETRLNQGSATATDQLLITELKQHFLEDIGKLKSDTSIDNPSLKTDKTPLWDQAEVENLSFGKVVVVPLHYSKKILSRTNMDRNRMFDIDSITQLLLYRNSDGSYHEEIIKSFADSLSTNSNYSGIIRIESWNGQLLREYKYQNGIIKQLQLNLSGKEPSLYALIQTCYSLDQYVYSADDPSGGVYSSQPLGCNTYFLDAGGGSSSSGSSIPTGSDYKSLGKGGSSGSKLVTTYRGDSPIGNVAAYIKCFENTPGATYSVTLMVNQPTAGSRASFSSFSLGGGSTFTVGHTFLSFQQDIGGVVTRREMGFYPSGTVTPLSPSSRGSLNDDEGNLFNISLTISMTGSQFMNTLNTFADGNNEFYNINTNNCATLALTALAAGGVTINTKPGSWPFGGGDDPGDLGEDIRNMPLLPNMTRSTSPGLAPNNLNSCN